MKDFDSDYFYSICYVDMMGNFNDIGMFFRRYDNALNYKKRDERAIIVKVHFED